MENKAQEQFQINHRILLLFCLLIQRKQKDKTNLKPTQNLDLHVSFEYLIKSLQQIIRGQNPNVVQARKIGSPPISRAPHYKQFQPLIFQQFIHMDAEAMTSLPLRPRSNYLDKCPKINLSSNLYKVNFNDDSQVHVYAFTLSPEINHQNRQKLKNVLTAAKNNISSAIGPHVQSGRTFFASGKSSQKLQTIKFILGNELYEMTLKLVKSMSLGDIHSIDKSKNGIVFGFLNNMIKKFFNQLHFIEIGKSKKFFDPNNRIYVDNAGIMIFKGYSTSFNLLESGLFLKVDPSMKIVQNKSVLEVINQIYSRYGDKSKSEKRLLIQEELINKMVMANYGKSRYYVIQDIIFDVALDTYHFTSEEKSINLLEYYKQTYNISIQNKKQPLVKASTGQMKKKVDLILIPQLLLMSGLPDDFDQRKRREISQYTIIKPAQKYQETENFMNSLNRQLQNFNPTNIAENLGITIEKKLAKVSGKQLPNPILQLSKNDKIDDNKVASFMLFNKAIYSSNISLKLSVVCNDNFDLSQIKDLMSSTCRNLNIEYKMKVFNVNFNDARASMKKIEQILFDQCEKKETNIFWYIIPPHFKNNYKIIKRMTLKTNIQINSQVTVASTFNKKGFASVFTKILLQMAAKIGNKLWVPRVSTPLLSAGVMIIGVESTPDKENKKQTVVSYCATMNNEMSQYHSNYYYQDCSAGPAIKMKKIITECLNQFINKNSLPPQEIVLLKNGTSKNQLPLIVNSEVNEAKQAIKSIPRNFRASHLTYVVVDRNVSQKFFIEKNNDVVNPFYGTLVNSDVVSNNYDFYIVPQMCNRGTAKPSYFKVLHTDSKMQEGLLEELMYIQCFNYMNWTGSVRVPGALQYAKKLAMYIAEHINNSSDGESIRRHLYYI